MKRAAIVAAILALTLTGCSTADSGPAPATQASPEQFLATHGLAEGDVRGIIDHLDRQEVTERPTDLIASVRPDELVLSDEEQEVILGLPEDLSYVSIAPYTSRTHDCFYHSLTTCLGELSHENIRVTITDGASGEVLVEEETTTFDNGFIGFWLPADAAGTIEVTHQGRTGTTDFSTTADAATCITDLRLT